MKDNYIKLRVTEKEKKLIKEISDKNGMNTSEYIRYILRSEIRKEKEYDKNNIRTTI